MHLLSRPRLSDRRLDDKSKSLNETLYDRVARARARWLRRIMYESSASTSQKCFAYMVQEHLNCVTLDAWPSQERLAQLMGCNAVKTVRRAAIGLERIGELTISTDRKQRRRYAPRFLDADLTSDVSADGHFCPEDPDKNDRESFLEIHPTKSFPTETVRQAQPAPYMSSTKRGKLELKIAELLGADGWEVLHQLSKHDDAIVQRLCDALSTGALGTREITAARLAARQL
jgi:hypothetical protein